MKLRDYASISDRRSAVEKACGVSLPHIGTYSLDEERASTRHCENMIGVTQIPLGIAGPLHITAPSSLYPSSPYYLPLATTEGALVASVSRGCKALTESGGVVVDGEDIGASRGPVFRVESISEGERLRTFLHDHFSDLKQVAEKTSHHLTLETYTMHGAGSYRFIRFVFHTGEAMGLNMITIATTALTTYITEKIGIRCISVSGNFCVDKKPAWTTMLLGRGKSVRAEAVIPASVLASVMKTTPDRLYETWLGKCLYGSSLSGSLGFNAQYANIVGAMFLATGQDPGHIVEGSMGMTTTEVRTSATKMQELYISVHLPALMVGTVGGGTELETQKEALSLLGCGAGDKGSAMRLAGIIAAAALAGELSLLASLSQGTLACAHQTLGRGGK